MPRRPTNIVLVGFMGSGKTEIGRRLAELTRRQFVDTDELVAAEGQSIPDIFATEGESGFRRREKRAVGRAAATKGAVIATGGGAVLDPENVKTLRRHGTIVYLDVEGEELHRRLESSSDRPLLDPAEGPEGAVSPERRRARIDRLLRARVPVYSAAADHVLPCGALSADEAAEQILMTLGLEESTRGLRAVTVPLERPYQVYVGAGLLRAAGDLIPLRKGAEKACVVSHPRVARLYAEALEGALRQAGLQTCRFVFPEGEAQKTPETVTKAHRYLAKERFHRSDLVVALGGGVTGDVAGYIASSYARGVGFAQAPTTLLAMVDAAIGGKTGVNLPEGKNLVGSFYQPSVVVADLDTLATLPDRELRGGLAEVVKYALIAEPELGDLVTGHVSEVFARDTVLQPVVERSAAVKARIVGADEKEAGVRAFLNYGHTLGHALEALALAGRPLGSGRSNRLHHGEAIAIGMVFAAWVSVLAGIGPKELVDEHVRLLGAVGLPTSLGKLAWKDVLPYVEVDKKYEKGLRLVLLSEPGRPVLQGDIPSGLLAEAMKRVSGD